MKCGTAYRRSDGWYFHSDSITTVGIGLGTPPHLKLDITAGQEELGQAVLDALAGSKTGLPHPTPEAGDRMFDPMLQLARVKTWAAFSKNAKNVRFVADSQWLIFEPWQNAGPKRGFVPIAGPEIRIPVDSSAAEIGGALRDTMALCT